MRLKSSLFSLSAALLFSALWSAPALGDSINTDRSCGSSAAYFIGETVQIKFFVGWAFWFQRIRVTVYDAQGNLVLEVSAILPPFVNGGGTRYINLYDSRPRGQWQATLSVNWGYGSSYDSCSFFVADAALAPPSSPQRFINKGESHLYRLSTNPGTSYTATLICNFGNDFDLYLLDRNLNEIRSSAAYGCPDAIFFTASDSVYYLKVVAASGSDWYQLRVF